MSNTVTATQVQQIKIGATLKRKLLNELKAYQELDAQIKAFEHAKEKHKETIEKYRAEAGAEQIEIEGFKIAYVQPTRTVVKSKPDLLTLGFTAAQIESMYERKPSTPYTKISVPGEKEREY